jgi:hypothetical protein
MKRWSERRSLEVLLLRFRMFLSGLEVKCDQKKQVGSSMQEWLEKLAFIKMDMKFFAKLSKYGIKTWLMAESLV